MCRFYVVSYDQLLFSFLLFVLQKTDVNPLLFLVMWPCYSVTPSSPFVTRFIFRVAHIDGAGTHLHLSEGLSGATLGSGLLHN